MQFEFISRDRDKALDQIKKMMYERLNRTRTIIAEADHSSGYLSAKGDERNWLEYVIDKLERS